MRISADGIARRLRQRAPWLICGLVALACTAYLERRADLVPKWGQWYMSDPHPYVELQLRAMMHGKLALFPHPSGADNDYTWGRGGMQQPWGLGLPILAMPLHLLARLCGAAAFPDQVRFLIFYALAAFALGAALHKAAGDSGPRTAVASAAAAGFFLVFPTFVGLLSARFEIYDQTIATGALWNVVLLAGLLALFHRCTPGRLALVCAAAAFVTIVRVSLAEYGVATLGVALAIAWKRGLPRRALLGGAGAWAAMTALYLAANYARFGAPFNLGYSNGVCGLFVDRMMRWGTSFSKVPFRTAAKEMLATLFLLDPVSSQVIGSPPEAVRPYVSGDRWREYYSQTYDPFVAACWVATLAIVLTRIVRGRMWRRDRPLDGELATVVGAWALPPTLILFVFYTRSPNMVTRYLVDMYPGFAASVLCVGIAVMDAVRRRAPTWVEGAQLGIAGAAALYLGLGRGWVTQLSHPIDEKTMLARIDAIERRSAAMPTTPSHFVANQPRGPSPVHLHLDTWGNDGSFASGMVFAMPHSPCVTFTFEPSSGVWDAPNEKSVEGLRVTADFDHMVWCGGPVADGNARKVTVCDPQPPPFLLDGMRLYAVASLDEDLNPIERAKLKRIDPAPACR